MPEVANMAERSGGRSMSPTSPSRPGTRGGRKGPGVEDLTMVANRLRTPMYISDRALPPENVTVQAVETLLSIPTVSGMSEDEFVAECAGQDGLVTDPAFEPGVASLYPNPELPPANAIRNIMWRRVAGALYLPTGKLPKLLQGAMDNHAFLGALAAVACKQELLLDLIVSDDQAAHGVYMLQFYKHGCWQRVLIDNYLPCIDGEDRLAFACSGHVGELWPSFMEKGYAKLHGSYYAIEGGSVCDSLTDLTGGVATKHKLNEQPAREQAQSGALWLQLLSWLSTGGVVACKAKAPVDGEPVGPGGVLLNHVYSITDLRELDSGRTRLLRLHCPWPTPGGVWHGNWAAGGPEWSSSPGAQALADEVAASMQDESSFWMSYMDFIDIFNRLYVSRLFPPSWHQLTLHCGWQGPSAGGPYYSATASAPTTGAQGSSEPIPSSTWCCNPQFRLTVRKACEIVVSLGQQDPRVEARCHIKKAHRKRKIGLMVVKVPAGQLGRRWEVKPQELLLEAPLTAGREVTASFKAEPEYAYVVVPYTGAPSEEAAFVLRCFSGTPLEVEQLPSPLSLVLGGHWASFLAGGPRTASTFGSNPQYMISCQQRVQVVISLSRLDVKYAVLKPPYRPDQAVGLYLCAPERGGADGLAARKTAIRADAEIVAESGFGSNEEAVMLVTLDPGTPYVLIPCLATAGLEAPFELRLMSGVPLELVPLPELKTVVLQGEWREDCAGGCDLHPTWKKNPRYLLALSAAARTKIHLSRAFKRLNTSASFSSPRKMLGTSNVDDMVGFYILKASDAAGGIKGDLRKAIQAETTFVTTGENSAEYDLQGGVPYVIIPCTYGPGRTGRFTLALTSPADFDLVEL